MIVPVPFSDWISEAKNKKAIRMAAKSVMYAIAFPQLRAETNATCRRAAVDTDSQCISSRVLADGVRPQLREQRAAEKPDCLLGRNRWRDLRQQPRPTPPPPGPPDKLLHPLPCVKAD